MQAWAFVMAILGCGESEAPCEEIALAASRYPSREACMAATEAELGRHGEALYPVVVAECRREGDTIRSLTGVEVARPEPPVLRRK